jgi:hypothetical protein
MMISNLSNIIGILITAFLDAPTSKAVRREISRVSSRKVLKLLKPRFMVLLPPKDQLIGHY